MQTHPDNIVLTATNPYTEPLEVNIENGPTLLLSPGDVVQTPMVLPSDMQIGSYVARRNTNDGNKKLVKHYYIADKNASIYPIAVNNYPFS
jgi:hypothetical protein